MQFLSRYLVTFDFPNKVAYFHPSSNVRRPDRFDASGLHLLLRRGKTVVEFVDDGSPASDIGLQVRDCLTHIDGDAVSDFSLFDIQCRLCQAGQVIKLSIERSDKNFDVTLKLNHWHPKPEFRPLPSDRVGFRTIPDRD